jgi:phospholipase C
VRFSWKFPCVLAFSLCLAFIPGCGTDNSNMGGGGGGGCTSNCGGGGGSDAPAVSHLIIVMMQNHSFDNLFGTFPGANGLDPTAASYSQVDLSGSTVSPTLLADLSPADLNHDRTSYIAAWDNGKMDKYAYTNGDLSMQYYDNTVSGLTSDNQKFGISTLWSYAQNYALADNFFASAMNNEPANGLYMVAATIHDDHTSGSFPYYDNCSAVFKSQSGGSIAVPLTETNVGDQLSSKDVSWAWYQENFNTSQDSTCQDYVPQENAFQYFTSTANSSHVQTFTMSGFQSSLGDGSLPSVVWIQGDGVHTMHPGAGNVLDGIQWLDNIVQAVKKSSIWSNTAIIVLWDESGGWYDHVAPPQLANTQGLGARVPVVIISPLAKAGYISHQQMDFVSILRFIQFNWKLGEFSAADQAAREQQSGDLCDLLTADCGPPSQ